MDIAIANRQRTKKVNRRRLKQIAAALLEELGLAKVEIGICLVAAQEMTRLNERFLKHKGATDVITFDYSFVVRLQAVPGGEQRRLKSTG